MEKMNLSELTDEQLLDEKKKLKKSKLMHALVIGFLAGIVIFGTFSAFISKNFVVFIPLLFPIYVIYRLVNTPVKNNDLEVHLNQRKLDQ